MVYSSNGIHDYSLRNSNAGEVTPHRLHRGFGNSFDIPRHQDEYRSYYRPSDDHYYSGYRNYHHQGIGNPYHRSLDNHYSVGYGRRVRS